MSRIKAEIPHWKHASTPDEIIERIKPYSTIDKWVPFYYFAKSRDSKKNQVFIDYINSSYFSAEELASRLIHMQSSTIKYWPASSRAAYSKRIAASPDFKNIIKTKIERSTSETNKAEYFSIINLVVEDDTELIDYFSVLNPADVHIAYQKLPDITNRLNNIASQDTPESKETKRLLVNGLYAHWLNDLREDIGTIQEYRDKHTFSDWEKFEFLAANKNMSHLFEELLALDIISPQSLLSRYSKDDLENFNPAIRNYIKPDRWKYSSVPSFIIRNIPDDQIWDAYEYFLENNPQLFAVLEKRYPSIFGKKQALSHYFDTDLSKLSPPVRKKIEPIILSHKQGIAKSAQTRQQLKAEREAARAEIIPSDLIGWLTSDNQLKSYFKLAGELEIKSKHEYLYIANLFIDSDLSAAAFCHKYRISDLTGFREMVKQVASENSEFSEKLSAKNQLSSKKYLLTTKRNVQALLTNKIDVKTFLEQDSSKSRKIREYIEFIQSTYNDPRITALFCKRIIDYYYDRLNSYSLSIEPENIKNMLTSTEVSFIAGAENYQKLLSGKSIDLGSEFYNAVLPSRDALRTLLQTKMNGSGADKIRNKLLQYGEHFQHKKALGMTIGNYNGNTVMVTEEVIRSAYAFQKANKLFPSSGTMTRIIRSIAEGKIECSEKSKNTPSTYEMMLAANSLEEYFLISTNENE